MNASWRESDPETPVELEVSFGVQPGLVFAVGANLQGDLLCLWVGDSFFCEWFPCSDSDVVEKFQSCFQGVLSGQVRLIEFVRDGRTIKAQLQDCASGRWQTVATWTTLRWPSLRNPDVRVSRNIHSRGHARVEFDKGLIADLTDEALPGGDTYVKACEAIRREARQADLPLLRPLLGDRSALVREAAAWPIADLEGLSALRDLLIAYQRGIDDGCDNDGFTALLLDLVARDSEDARAQLQRLAHDAIPQVRENALWLLAHCAAAGDR
ncbi:MAG: hypothetical protein GC160_25415 [Acidobacteria bacterium]|nr:hypothetical protein [Acidobacteriota bacterium]